MFISVQYIAVAMVEGDYKSMPGGAKAFPRKQFNRI